MHATSKKVLVALSGGVDSSVSTALLLKEGYEVECAFIKTWSPSWLPCTWRQEQQDAMRVAAHLHVPFHTVDLSQEYEHAVVEYLVSEYREGRTPNPDVMCNKHIKFGGFFDWAIERGFDYVATGHYARVKCVEGVYQLLAGLDGNKDQSYFLWTLTQKHLAHTLFPVGEYEKPEVRKLAEKFGLPTAKKKDSQGVCFLGKLDMKEFLGHYIDAQPGDVLDLSGVVIGKHDGAVFYTLGQRHGFVVQHTGTNDAPVYVVSKNITENSITVAPRVDAAVGKNNKDAQHIILSKANWIAGMPPTPRSLHPTPYLARLRYRQPLFPVCVDASSNEIVVMPNTPEPYVPEGQSLVLYDTEVCLGGGTIASCE